MRDEQTNRRQPMTCTWVAVAGADGRPHLEARWLSGQTAAAQAPAAGTPAEVALVGAPVAAHAA